MGHIGAWKLNEEKVAIIKELLDMGDYTHQQIADLFGVSREHITKINQGQRWNDDIKSFRMKTGNDFREFTPKNNNVRRTEMEIQSIIIKLKDGTELELR